MNTKIEELQLMSSMMRVSQAVEGGGGYSLQVKPEIKVLCSSAEN
jgi:hypothetical protein